MARTVSVRLQADIGQYQRGMQDASRSTKTLGGEIEKTAKAGHLDDLGDQAKGLGSTLDRTSTKAQRDLAEITKHAATLDRQIRDTEKGLQSLAKGFAATGDPKILAAMREQQSLLGELGRVRRFLPDPAEAARAGLTLGQRLGDGITKAVPPQMRTALIAGGVAASPFLAATVVGAVTGGAGLMGIGGGVALALRDPAIKAEAKDLGSFIDARLRQSAGAFGPSMIDAIGIVRTEFADLGDEFDRIFDNSASHLGPLTASTSKALGDIIEGLDRVVATSGPALAEIGEGLEGIGEQTEYFLNMVASNSDVGAKALGDLFAIIEFGMQSLTTSVDLLSTAYKWGTAWTTLIPGMDSATDGLGASAKDAGDSVNGLGKSVEGAGVVAQLASQKFVALEDAVAASTGRNLDAAEANIALRASYVSVTGAIDKKRAVTDSEMTGLIEFAKTANSHTKALDEQGRTVDQATAAHEANRKKLIETAIRMGATREEAVRLANQYLNIPKAVATAISQPGMKQSRADVKRYHEQLDDITRQIKTSVTVEGDAAAYRKLERLLIQQRALANPVDGTGRAISLSAHASAFRKQEAKVFHAGGWTGPGSKWQPAGVVHADEWVIRKESQQRVESAHPGILDHINRYGELPEHARGGLVAPFRVSAAGARIPSYREAMSAVAPAVPSGGRTSDWIVATVKARFPGIDVLSKDRPGARTLSGSRSYHALGRAVDFEPSEELAAWWDANYRSRTKELISPYQQHNIHNGERHRYTGAVWNQHNFAGGNAHDHIAMANGGVIREPVLGVGASGRTYSFAERGPEVVIPGNWIAQGGGGAAPAGPTYNINVTASPLAHPGEVGRQVVYAIQAYERGSGTSWRG